eukprot:CAMPEP_0197716438 /NCGR_PEP_ID=MMETSP1434-20131217/1326_1 /TAXON_ID=265543 /ORGANISM="Minutocellus polymorphus, Strain CCMP3303" /LENGTH=107 /DNA_ID=CAMNT_0043300799 /DNA_START=85 /DNA_END=409 /DNA_ORIENTATION=+
MITFCSATRALSSTGRVAVGSSGGCAGATVGAGAIGSGIAVAFGDVVGETTAASSAVADGRGKSKLSAEVSAVSAEDDGDGELRSRSPPGGGGEGSEAMVAEREWKK